jgi:hypothetical protein
MVKTLETSVRRALRLSKEGAEGVSGEDGRVLEMPPLAQFNKALKLCARDRGNSELAQVLLCSALCSPLALPLLCLRISRN